LLNDEQLEYEDELIKGLTYLSENYEAPLGKRHNDYARSIRYYPLVVLLYISFITGISQKRVGYLKKLLALKLRARTSMGIADSIVYALFYLRDADEAFKTLHPSYPNSTWCDSIASYLFQTLKTYIVSEDLLLDYESLYFQGEFALCLTPLDVTPRDTLWHVTRPSSGAYLYYDHARYAIKNLLSGEKQVLENIYSKPLKDILALFDSSVNKLIPFSCSASGFAGKAVASAYTENK
jgi:hypothetical protein